MIIGSLQNDNFWRIFYVHDNVISFSLGNGAIQRLPKTFQCSFKNLVDFPKLDRDSLKLFRTCSSFSEIVQNLLRIRKNQVFLISSGLAKPLKSRVQLLMTLPDLRLFTT